MPEHVNQKEYDGLGSLPADIANLVAAAGIGLEDSFDAGSKWCVGDAELIRLIHLAKEEEREACQRTSAAARISGSEETPKS